MPIDITSARLPFVADRIDDPFTVHRSLAHPLRGKSQPTANAAGALPWLLGSAANTLREPPAALAGASVAAPALAIATAKSAQATVRNYRETYPAARTAVQSQERRLAERRAQASQLPEGGRGGGGEIDVDVHVDDLAAIQHEETLLERRRLERRNANVQRVTQPLVTLALGGYAGTTVCNAAANAARVAADAAPHVGGGATAAAATLATVGGAIALPAQATMLTARSIGVANAALGLGRLREDVDAVDGAFSADDPTRGATIDALNRRKTYVRAKMLADAGGALSQASLFTAGVLTLAGPAVAAAPVLAVIGASGVVASGLVDGVTAHKAARFNGAKASFVELANTGRRDTAQVIADHGLDATIAALSREHAEVGQRLALTKLMSLIRHVLRKEDDANADDESIEAIRTQRVRQLVKDGRKGPLTGTTLLPDEVRIMGEFFERGIAGTGFLAGSKHEVRRRVLETLLSDPAIFELRDDARTAQRVQTEAARGMQASDDPDIARVVQRRRGQRTLAVSDEAYESLIGRNMEARALNTESAAKVLTAQGKTDAAHRRSVLVDDLVDLARTQRALAGAGALESSSTEATTRF